MYQGRHQSKGRLGGDKGGVHLGGPGEVFGISRESISQRPEDKGSSRNEFTVKVHHSQKLLQGRVVSGQGKSRDGSDMIVERSRSRAGDGVTKLFNLGGSKNTILKVDGEAVKGAEVKHMVEV